MTESFVKMTFKEWCDWAGENHPDAKIKELIKGFASLTDTPEVAWGYRVAGKKEAAYYYLKNVYLKSQVSHD